MGIGPIWVIRSLSFILSWEFPTRKLFLHQISGFTLSLVFRQIKFNAVTVMH